MKAIKINKIETIEDVKAFFKYITEDLNLVWAPDEAFVWDAIEDTDWQYTFEDAVALDKAMKECYNVCGAEEVGRLAFEAVDTYLSQFEFEIDEDEI